MAGTMTEQDRIDEEASAWVVLASDRALHPHEQREYERWRAADPRHGRTFDALSRTWSDIPALQGLADLVSHPRPGSTSHASTMPAPRRFRWWPAAAIVSVAACLLALVLVPLAAPDPIPSYRTDVAQMRQVTLSDGTRVTLGPRSTLTVDFDEEARRVALAGGQAFFDVSSNPARPFLVQAGPSLIRVVGTKFDVNLAAERVSVSVLEGTVQVTTPDPESGDGVQATEPALLRGGQRAEIDFAATPQIDAAEIIQVAPDRTAGMWRDGWLVYDDVALADIVADLNRYYPPGIVMTDPSVGELRVTASFKSTQIPAFVDSLSEILPLRADRRRGGGYALRARSG